MNAWVRKIMDKGKQLNCELQATMSDDRLGTTVRWSNANAHQMSGYVTTETQFLRNDMGKPYIYVDVKPSDIHVNDTVWHVKPANIIYDDGNLFVDHFSIEHNQQHIKVWGTATKSQNDSITIDLKDVDVNYILDLVHFRSVDCKGNATGQGFIKSVFQEPEMRAALQVKQFRFQDGSMGNLHANVEWNKKEKQIDIDAIADEGNGRHTLIKGYVSPPRNFIDKGLNKTEFAREVGISSNTLAKLSKNELVSLEVLVRICRQLDCSLGDVVQLAPPEPPIKSGLERMKKQRPTHEKGGNAYRHE